MVMLVVVVMVKTMGMGMEHWACYIILLFAGTGDYLEYPCPNGTFSNESALQAESDCFDCTAGWACVGLALLAPNTVCEAGYYCQGRAKTPAPLDTITGDKCPIGFYCPQGSGKSGTATQLMFEPLVVVSSLMSWIYLLNIGPYLGFLYFWVPCSCCLC